MTTNTSSGDYVKPETILSMARQEMFSSVRDSLASLNPAPSSKPLNGGEPGEIKSSSSNSSLRQVNSLTGSSISRARDPRLNGGNNKKMSLQTGTSPEYNKLSQQTGTAPYAFQKLDLHANQSKSSSSSSPNMQHGSASDSPVSVVSSSCSDHSNSDQVPESLLQGDTILNFLMEQLEEIKRTANPQNSPPSTTNSPNCNTTNTSSKRSAEQADLTQLKQEAIDSKRSREKEGQVVSKTPSCDSNSSAQQKSGDKPPANVKSSSSGEISTDQENKFKAQINLKQPSYAASSTPTSSSAAVKTTTAHLKTPSSAGSTWFNHKRPAIKRPGKPSNYPNVNNSAVKNVYAGQRKPPLFGDYPANFDAPKTSVSFGQGSGLPHHPAPANTAYNASTAAYNPSGSMYQQQDFNNNNYNNYNWPDYQGLCFDYRDQAGYNYNDNYYDQYGQYDRNYGHEQDQWRLDDKSYYDDRQAAPISSSTPSRPHSPPPPPRKAPKPVKKFKPFPLPISKRRRSTSPSKSARSPRKVHRHHHAAVRDRRSRSRTRYSRSSSRSRRHSKRRRSSRSRSRSKSRNRRRRSVTRSRSRNRSSRRRRSRSRSRSRRRRGDSSSTDLANKQRRRKSAQRSKSSRRRRSPSPAQRRRTRSRSMKRVRSRSKSRARHRTSHRSRSRTRSNASRAEAAAAARSLSPAIKSQVTKVS